MVWGLLWLAAPLLLAVLVCVHSDCAISYALWRTLLAAHTTAGPDAGLLAALLSGLPVAAVWVGLGAALAGVRSVSSNPGYAVVTGGLVVGDTLVDALALGARGVPHAGLVALGMGVLSKGAAVVLLWLVVSLSGRATATWGAPGEVGDVD